MNMKHFNFQTTGEVPQSLTSYINRYNGKQATKEGIYCLDSDISFLVCDLKECHGNLNNSNKTAWLAPLGNDNTWSINIEF